MWLYPSLNFDHIMWWMRCGMVTAFYALSSPPISPHYYCVVFQVFTACIQSLQNRPIIHSFIHYSFLGKFAYYSHPIIPKNYVTILVLCVELFTLPMHFLSQHPYAKLNLMIFTKIWYWCLKFQSWVQAKCFCKVMLKAYKFCWYSSRSVTLLAKFKAD